MWEDVQSGKYCPWPPEDTKPQTQRLAPRPLPPPRMALPPPVASPARSDRSLPSLAGAVRSPAFRTSGSPHLPAPTGAPALAPPVVPEAAMPPPPRPALLPSQVAAAAPGAVPQATVPQVAADLEESLGRLRQAGGPDPLPRALAVARAQAAAATQTAAAAVVPAAPAGTEAVPAKVEAALVEVEPAAAPARAAGAARGQGRMITWEDGSPAPVSATGS